MAKLRIAFLLAALLILVSSCTPAASVEPTVAVETTATVSQNGLPQTEADVPRVSVEDAAAAIQSGEAVVVDVRSLQAYQASHIPGALSIPLAQIESNPAGVGLEKDKWIITYCT